MQVFTQYRVLLPLSVIPVVLASTLWAGDSKVSATGDDGKLSVVVADAQPFTFTRPHREQRGIRVVLQQLTAPETTDPNIVAYGRVSAALDDSLAADWRIVAFRAYEPSREGETAKRVKSYRVVPSKCNNFCDGAEEYDIPNLKSGVRYNVEYLIWPLTPTADPAHAISLLRRRTDRAITVRAWFDFAETSNAYDSLAAAPADN